MGKAKAERLEAQKARSEATVKAGERASREAGGKGTGTGGRGTAGAGGLENSARIEAGVRKRLAGVLSSAGVRRSDIALEVLFLLPQEFLRGYEELFHRALNASEDGRGLREVSKAELEKALGKVRNGGVRTTTGQETPMNPSLGGSSRKGSPVGGGGVFPIRNDKALGEKERVDRNLRKLAREMRTQGTGDGGSKAGVTKCTMGGCGKWLESTWRYCPFCGNVTGSTEGQEGSMGR